MKTLKKVMALIIAMVMVLGMSTSAFADGTTVQEADKGSITVKSPVMGAAYTAYRIFDLTINEAGDSMSYTIDTDSPFYEAVVAYAEATKTTTGEGDAAVTTYALQLTEITTETTTDDNGDVTYQKFNISVTDDFDPQDFGQAMRLAIQGDATADPAIGPSIAAADLEDVTEIPDYTDTTNKVITLADTDQITFKNLDLGYYLITCVYPEVTETASFDVPAYTDSDGTEHEAKTYTLDKDTTNAEIEAIADEYVAATVTDAAVTAYINDNNLKDKLVPQGRDLTEEEIASVKTQLESSTRQNTIEAIRSSLEAIKQSDADINVKEPVLVFVDSTTKSAEIIEKNELDRWDVPINPKEGEADLDDLDLPEHGEPDGGKNIIVGYADKLDEDGEKVLDDEGNPVQVPIYADWTEANIGDTITYEIRVNAMNFIREDDENEEDDDGINTNSEFDVKQVQEYIIGDYQNDALTFRPNTDTITVKIVDDEGNVVATRDANNEVVADKYEKWDYSAAYESFFLTDEEALNDNGTVANDILANGSGIVIPWVAEAESEEQAKKHKNYTTTTEPLYVKAGEGEEADADGNLLVDGEKVPQWVVAEEGETADDDGYLLVDGKKVQATKTHYWYSIYDSDVTIVVTYTMQLTDKATIDMPGNINYSEYGMNFVEDDTYVYEPDDNPDDDVPPTNPPGDENKPDKDSDKDTATVYTYALAIQKVDQDNNKLAGATFTIKGLTVEKLDDGYYKVVAYDPESTTESAKLVADKDGLLVIEGLATSTELTVTEADAPDGYNLLTAPVTMQATKVGEEVTTSASTTYYSDEKKTTVTGKVATLTDTKKYYAANGTIKAYTVTTGSGDSAVTKYYDSEDAEITETQFNTLVEGIKADYEGNKEVTSEKLTPFAVYVQNNKGTELPETGGIGTTLFYIVGAILVIGAGIVLITRRRMSAR